ncbi:hypothetical protein [Sulfuricurvum sp.]|uniref:hypothetical protein n=1 Tax=Sulfuricurvum sp. TaxID=2025608 RepID=UPI003BAF422D
MKANNLKAIDIDAVLRFDSENLIFKENTALKRLGTNIFQEIKKHKRSLSEKEIEVLNKAAEIINDLRSRRELALRMKKEKIKLLDITVGRYKMALKRHYGQISDILMIKYVAGRSSQAWVRDREHLIKQFEDTLGTILQPKIDNIGVFMVDDIVLEYEALFENVDAPNHNFFKDAVNRIAFQLSTVV